MRKPVGSKGKNFYFWKVSFVVFLAFWGLTENVYKIWLSLVQLARIFIFDPPPFWRGFKIESLDFWNFSFVCVTNSNSRRNFLRLEWLAVPYRFWWPVSEWVSQWVTKLAILSGPYLRIHLSYIIEIWYYPQDRLHNYMCIISALYLKWVPNCRGVEIGSKWFV